MDVRQNSSSSYSYCKQKKTIILLNIFGIDGKTYFYNGLEIIEDEGAIAISPESLWW